MTTRTLFAGLLFARFLFTGFFFFFFFLLIGFCMLLAARRISFWLPLLLLTWLRLLLRLLVGSIRPRFARETLTSGTTLLIPLGAITPGFPGRHRSGGWRGIILQLHRRLGAIFLFLRFLGCSVFKSSMFGRIARLCRFDPSGKPGHAFVRCVQLRHSTRRILLQGRRRRFADDFHDV